MPLKKNNHHYIFKCFSSEKQPLAFLHHSKYISSYSWKPEKSESTKQYSDYVGLHICIPSNKNSTSSCCFAYSNVLTHANMSYKAIFSVGANKSLTCQLLLLRTTTVKFENKLNLCGTYPESINPSCFMTVFHLLKYTVMKLV